MSPHIRLLVCAVVLARAVFAQHAGDLPPALVWDKLKGTCPASLDWPSLHGKVVVVEFPPDFTVPEDISEWNELADTFAGEPVVFMQAAGGSEFLLDQALKKTPYHGCVLFDRDDANWQNFGRPGFPWAVVVDSQGWIAGYARDTDEETVRAVLDHQKTAELYETFPQPKYVEHWKLDSVPSYDVHISPAPKGEWPALGSVGTDRYLSRNQSLKAIISDVWETAPTRIVFPENLDDGSYDLSAYIPESNGDVLMRLVRDAVERYFGLSVQKETRTKRVYLLTAVRPSDQLRVAGAGEDPMAGARTQSLIGVARSLRDMADCFEAPLDVPVMDQTGLSGKYDYSVTSELQPPDSVFEMAGQLGLKLTEAERPVEVVVVRKVR